MSPAPPRFCAHCGAPRTPGVGWCQSCHADDGDGGVTISKPVAAAAPATTWTPPVARPRGRLLVGAAVALVLVAGASYAVTDVLTTDDAAQSAAEAPPAPASPRRRRALEPDPSSAPSAPSTTPTGPSTPATPSAPAVTGTPSAVPSATPAATGDQRDLPCGSGYVVVLASDEAGTPEQTVQTAFADYAGAPDLHYLDPAQSCSNLSSMTDKSALGLVPYMGPFGDPVAACDARMEHLDTRTYVVGVDAAATTATYCACPYEDSAQPTLTPEQHAEPLGDDEFWVLELQYMLHEAGYNPDRLVPGKYGPLTADMVRQLQAGSGLPVTGDTDPGTWSALEDLVC